MTAATRRGRVELDTTEGAEPTAGPAGRPGRVDAARVRQVGAVLAGAIGLLGLVGFVVSFTRLTEAARPSFGDLAPAVSVGVDLGIGVFSAARIVLAWLEMPARWVRPVPAALTAATIYLNVAGEHDPFAIVAHAVLPGLWVLAVGVAEHVVRHRLALDTGTRMDTVRGSRWLLAPAATAKLWRRMVLWEIRSYPAALARERDRLLARTELQDRYGPITWRWRAPRQARALYRLGELTPTTATPAAGAAPLPSGTAGDRTGDPPGRTPSRPGSRGRSARGRKGGATDGGGRNRSIDDLRAELAAAVAAGRIEVRPTAEAIRTTLACSPSRARLLRDETARGGTVTALTPAGSGSAGSGSPLVASGQEGVA